MTKKIGLETSSIMPLLETTTRTLPLQQYVKKTTDRYNVEFITDSYSVTEATQQIIKSFDNAAGSIKKAKVVAERLNIKDMQTLTILFVKSLSENWYGREETLRWSDVVINEKFKEMQNSEGFFQLLNQQIENKKQNYLAMLQIKNKHLNINCKHIQSYWITPVFIKDLDLKIKVIPNGLSLEDFFGKLQSAINFAHKETFKINDIVDIYHLYSIYNDANVKEIWSCNQLFVKRHEKYLKTVEEFKDLFNDNLVTIKRIK
ncbi:MAG: hypothetical protein ABIH24_02820 [Verrucomicrobiota bacterium]